MSNAFLYPLYPTACVDDKSNPKALLVAKYCPVWIIVAGSIPSKPPWKGTENFKSTAFGPEAPDKSTDALKDPL